ncbi:hypothetical protein PYW07_000711 [Mythimna separata]|uniref:Uncharacterized protein n=1 Tax=Mythimna separata TaxID=271217 RepID=A0AAD7YTJ8_MYTSE|nr:hypothetical protein PYW07_000711 [Mythimna separata]
MELLHVIIKSGPSPRPLAWSLEVSSSEDGDDWRMVRAFGDRDHCRKLWDLRPERRRRKARAAKRMNRADKPACSTQFASPRPLENGEMHVGIGEGVTARRVRVSFRAAHAASPRHQYYSVRALTLAARCLCHGHAEHCHVTAQGAKCECDHGTCGAHCQRCCGGGTWAPHEPCEDLDRSECSCGERGACSYDDTGAILCVNCTENRAGPLCDRCLFGYYNALPDGPCVPCDCDPQGSDGSCKWDKKHRQIACTCFPGFSGSLCGSCEDPTAEFPSCQAPVTPACRCDPRGVLDPERVCDEVCECKSNVVGERCDACAPGHFGLSADLPTGCRPCYCSHITDTCSLAAPEELEPPRDVSILPRCCRRLADPATARTSPTPAAWPRLKSWSRLEILAAPEELEPPRDVSILPRCCRRLADPATARTSPTPAAWPRLKSWSRLEILAAPEELEPPRDVSILPRCCRRLADPATARTSPTPAAWPRLKSWSRLEILAAPEELEPPRDVSILARCCRRLADPATARTSPTPAAWPRLKSWSRLEILAAPEELEPPRDVSILPRCCRRLADPATARTSPTPAAWPRLKSWSRLEILAAPEELEPPRDVSILPRCCRRLADPATARTSPTPAAWPRLKSWSRLEILAAPEELEPPRDVSILARCCRRLADPATARTSPTPAAWPRLKSWSRLEILAAPEELEPPRDVSILPRCCRRLADPATARTSPTPAAWPRLKSWSRLEILAAPEELEPPRDVSILARCCRRLADPATARTSPTPAAWPRLKSWSRLEILAAPEELEPPRDVSILARCCRRLADPATARTSPTPAAWPRLKSWSRLEILAAPEELEPPRDVSILARCCRRLADPATARTSPTPAAWPRLKSWSRLEILAAPEELEPPRDVSILARCCRRLADPATARTSPTPAAWPRLKSWSRLEILAAPEELEPPRDVSILARCCRRLADPATARTSPTPAAWPRLKSWSRLEIPCYCSHITDTCSLAAPEELEPPRDVILPLGEAWLISDSQGNKTLEPSIDEQGKPFVISYEVEGWEYFYWMTSSFNGDQLAAYGGEVRASLYWGIVRGDTGGNPTFGPDVVLLGTDGTKLAYSNTSYETAGQLQISVPLLEGAWRVLGDDEPATRTQLMDVLRDLKGIMLKAHYHFDQDEVRLEGAGVRGGVVPREKCVCPRGHTGAHCQRCAWHHARPAPRLQCLPCACNHHAACDTGNVHISSSSVSARTHGRALPALRLAPRAPRAAPAVPALRLQPPRSLRHRVRADTRARTASAAPGTTRAPRRACSACPAPATTTQPATPVTYTYHHHQCPRGHTGAHCQRCAWHHARPAPRLQCLPCACNHHAACDTGNVHISSSSVSARTHGRALPALRLAPRAPRAAPAVPALRLQPPRSLRHRVRADTRARTASAAPGTTRAPRRACSACPAPATTTQPATPVTYTYHHHQCPRGHTGAHCQRCAWHHARPAPRLQCLPCACNHHAACDTGNVHISSSSVSARTHGRALPALRLAPRAPRAAPAVPALRLQPPRSLRHRACPAPATTTQPATPVTYTYHHHQCPRGHTGAHCQRCAWHHARPGPRQQCLPCACNHHAACDTVDGPCGPCQHNTTGPHCERCLPGHYGNPVTGACKPCACPLFEASNNFSPNCALAGPEGDEYVCTQCPDGYTGDHCENCDFGYWGSPTTPGGQCLACQCGGSPCHPGTGRCLTCPPHSEGARCDLCKEGYWFGGGSAQAAGGCVACACGAGALSAACDARSGQCACREGWTGRACDRCSDGHGGVSAGCPACRCGPAAASAACDAATGACACAAGAAPPSCDSCLDEHYGLNATGCLGESRSSSRFTT